MHLVHVAVGVVRQADRVLIARRPDHVHQGGLLEFPGGKVEPDETVPHALQRELREEVAIDASPEHMRPLIQIAHDYGDKRVLLDVWCVDRFQGQARGLEGQPVEWLAVSALQDADFPAANRPIIRALRLPSQWLITPAEFSEATFKTRLARLGADLECGVLLRQPQLTDEVYLPLARQWVSQARVPVLLHGAPRRFEAVAGAAGLHLPQAEAARLQARPIPPEAWLGVSCHSPDELAHAVALGADYAFLSPVRVTPSHADQAPLGWERFAEWTSAATVPVYALGGMARSDLSCSYECGGQGIAGIRLWDEVAPHA
ncbi:Nudix family hydrolase [Marinobacteraceae bacterium S3BR75-40.1]